MRVQSGPWAIGVQWHPEFFGYLDPASIPGAPLIDNGAIRAAFLDEVGVNP
ncbi:MAG: hypothetical protein R2714_11235 [Microthrixaceae bacterium]